MDICSMNMVLKIGDIACKRQNSVFGILKDHVSV